MQIQVKPICMDAYWGMLCSNQTAGASAAPHASKQQRQWLSLDVLATLAPNRICRLCTVCTSSKSSKCSSHCKQTNVVSRQFVVCSLSHAGSATPAPAPRCPTDAGASLWCSGARNAAEGCIRRRFWQQHVWRRKPLLQELQVAAGTAGHGKQHGATAA